MPEWGLSNAGFSLEGTSQPSCTSWTDSASEKKKEKKKSAPNRPQKGGWFTVSELRLAGSASSGNVHTGPLKIVTTLHLSPRGSESAACIDLEVSKQFQRGGEFTNIHLRRSAVFHLAVCHFSQLEYKVQDTSSFH